MNITDFIRIDTVYTRSVNIERDSDSSAIIKAYIPNSRALSTLHRIADTLNQENIPRSWALIGPYGSGKSSFAIFLSHLLDNQAFDPTNYAYAVLNKADRTLCDKFKNHTTETKGYLSILITGAPEPLGKRFLIAMYDAAVKYWQKVGRNPKILTKINNTIEQTSATTHEIIELVEELRCTVENTGKGILIVFDEFGKFLEYEARHYGANDIYLLQSLSELALNGKKANFYIFTLMHQGFEEYARGLGKNLRNEWNKIQGRFEVIPFLESTEQTIHIIGKAFINNLSEIEKVKIKRNCENISETLLIENALPGTLDKNTATELFSKCYPLHPISTIILPILCQKMAQNERTLFSYLGSREQFGFKDSLSRLNNTDKWIMPSEIYEYFIQNQPAVLTDPTTHRRWAEVVTAVERLGDAHEKEIEMLKTIGLFNIIGAQAGFKATRKIIELCSSNKNSANIAVSNLTKKSLLQFRKFSNEYRVWQGSDFDLEEAVQNELGQIGKLDLPETIDNLKILQPIVAHRHTIEKATLRYFMPFFVDNYSYKRQAVKADHQRMIFCFAESSDEIIQAESTIIPYFSENDIIAICPNGNQLRQTVAEVTALHRVEQNCPELNTDPIAKKEFTDRLSVAEHLQDQLLSALIGSPESSQWYWKNKKIKVTKKRDLQQKLSDILDNIYIHTPLIKNELINREKPSAQAAAARNKLVFAMLHNIEKQELGIEKFPAEKGIYKSFLLATGLHTKNTEGHWELVPPKKENKYNFHPVWKEIDNFLETTQKTPKSFTVLNETLIAPPYGVKAGVLPLLYLTVFLCYQDELAFYENGIYSPYITDQHIERFMKRPDFFTVQRLRIKGIRASLFNSYAKVLYGENVKLDISLLTIARPLAKFIDNLEDYTKQTNRLSDGSQKAIKAFALAKSPADLLFNRLPKACSFPEIDPDETNIKKIEGFTDALIKVIKELRDAYKIMLDEFLGIISKALLPDIDHKIDLMPLRKKVQARYEDLEKYTVDIKGLKPFIENITEKNATNEVWINRLLLFLGGRSAKKWSDVDRDNAVLRLTDFSKRLYDLCILQSYYIKNKAWDGENFEIIRLRSMRYGKSENDQIIKLDPSTKEYIEKQKQHFYSILSKLDTDELRIALLADIIDDYLTKTNKKILPATKVANV